MILYLSQVIAALRRIYVGGAIASFIGTAIYLIFFTNNSVDFDRAFLGFAFWATFMGLIALMTYYVYRNLPKTKGPLLWLVFSPLIWFLIQLALSPSSAGYYLLSFGISTTLSAALAWVYFLVVILLPTWRGGQIVLALFFIGLFGSGWFYASWYSLNYYLGIYVFRSSDPLKWISLSLWICNMVHHLIHFIYLLNQEKEKQYDKLRRVRG